MNKLSLVPVAVVLVALILGAGLCTGDEMLLEKQEPLLILDEYVKVEQTDVLLPSLYVLYKSNWAAWATVRDAAVSGSRTSSEPEPRRVPAAQSAHEYQSTAPAGYKFQIERTALRFDMSTVNGGNYVDVVGVKLQAELKDGANYRIALVHTPDVYFETFWEWPLFGGVAHGTVQTAPGAYEWNLGSGSAWMEDTRYLGVGFREGNDLYNEPPPQDSHFWFELKNVYLHVTFTVWEKV